MANSDPSPATRYRPGEVWTGRPRKLTDEQKELWRRVRKSRDAAREHFTQVFERIKGMTRSELERLAKSKTANVVELVVARTVLRTIAGGQIHQFLGLVEAWCGPEPKQVELSGPGGEPLSPASTLTVDELVRVYRELDQLAKGAAPPCNSTQISPPSCPPSPESLPPLSGTEF